MIENALRTRRRRPMFLVDIAVPRDVAADVAQVEDVFLYTIDDLKQVIDDNLRSRQAAAREAEAIIDLQVEHYLAWRRALELRNPLAALRRDAEAQRESVLGKARQMLASGRSPEQALDFLAHTLTNKLLHAPSANLRAAAQRGDIDLLRAAEQLFDAATEETATTARNPDTEEKKA
jgi:glutamyl-tRNA reductase